MYAPYHCDYCDKDDRVLYQIDRDFETPLIHTVKGAGYRFGLRE